MLKTGMTYRPATDIESYHAHIYYDGGTKQTAANLRREIARRFTVEMGRWRDVKVGPHPISMYQVAFARELFPEIVPWLALNRKGLAVLVHPNTGDAYEDHSANAMWLGTGLDLDLDALLRASDEDADGAGAPEGKAP